MSHQVAVVCDASVALGFQLAGLRPRVVGSRAAADTLLSQMTEEPAWGVILVQEDMMPDAPRNSRRGGAGLPVLVPFPAPSLERPPGEAEAYVAELLRRAVGYRVRLR